MRGIPPHLLPQSVQLRITPACAGNTGVSSAPDGDSVDHPRVCGEYSRVVLFIFNILGSPPRVRGILMGFCYFTLVHRITPACAGNTSCFKNEVHSPRDHPRVCGEYLTNLLPTRRCPGSPPRVRGIPWDDFTWIVDDGITPACAGNTRSQAASKKAR